MRSPLRRFASASQALLLTLQKGWKSGWDLSVFQGDSCSKYSISGRCYGPRTGLFRGRQMKNSHFWQVSVSFRVVQSKSHHELVGDHESNVVRVNIRDSSLDFV